MLSYEELSKRPETFRSFAGLEVSEFDSIYAKVEPRYEGFERKRLSRGDRKHDIGAGHPFKLSLRDRLLMLLVYYRTYITSTLAAFLFDLDQSNVLKDIRMLEPLVRECVPIPKKVYEVARSRGKDVPRQVLGDYRGVVISDSWGAWNHIGGRWQRCLVHYLRELEDTVKYKSPGAEFLPFRKKLRRILRDAIRMAEENDHGRRLGAKARLE